MVDFSGKVIAVSGGTSGINLGIARHFARRGARVFVFSRSLDKVKEAVRELVDLGAEADGMSADVRDWDAVRAAFAHCRERFGQIDILVSGAAGNFLAKAKDISSNGFRAVMEIDVLGTHHVIQGAYPHLRKPGASVINISAPQASVAMLGQSHVSAAKAGVDMLTRSLALEWGPEGIRVNSINPGPIEGTEGVRRLVPGKKAADARIKGIPLRRMGQIDDVANLAAFLSSDAASYITGAVIPVDGGTMLNPQPTRMQEFLDKS